MPKESPELDQESALPEYTIEDAEACIGQMQDAEALKQIALNPVIAARTTMSRSLIMEFHEFSSNTKSRVRDAALMRLIEITPDEDLQELVQLFMEIPNSEKPRLALAEKIEREGNAHTLAEFGRFLLDSNQGGNFLALEQRIIFCLSMFNTLSEQLAPLFKTRGNIAQALERDGTDNIEE
jgi:hypothetical protein